MKRKIKLGPGRLHHQTARSYCFVPPLKPSPLRGEGAGADAVTDEGSSYSRLCSSHGTCQRGSTLQGWFLSERPERNQRDAGERSRRDHGSTCVPPGARSPLSPGPDARDAGLGHGTGVRRGWGTTHSSPVCAAAAGVSNGHAHPAVVSRLDWQNRGSRCEISGRAKAEDISSQGQLPAARKAFPPQGGRCHGGCRDG